MIKIQITLQTGKGRRVIFYIKRGLRDIMHSVYDRFICFVFGKIKFTYISIT